MKTLLIGLLVVFVATVSASSVTRPADAGNPWPPLINCSDVNGDGAVAFADFLGLLQNFGNAYPSTDYHLLYDLNGDKSVAFADFLMLLQDFGTQCPLIESQVAKAAAATIQYEDCNAAIADGYSPGSGGVYVPNMGIHISKLPLIAQPFNIETPFGLVCSETFPGSTVVDRLIGLWYIIPVDSTCLLYLLPLPCADASDQPVGFGLNNSDEDNIDPDGPGILEGWHTHTNLCVGPGFLNELGVIADPEGVCTALGGFLLVPTYGWMLHVYTAVPNPVGRFTQWNLNPDLP